jgi:tRNA A37 methylthiotransferase MiaB
VGWNGEVIVDERRQSDSLIARNFAYKPIVIKTNEDLLGKMAVVRVTGHHSSYLNGVLAFFE